MFERRHGPVPLFKRNFLFMRILLYTDNLLTRSNLEATWRNHGAQCLPRDAADSAQLIVVDLTAKDATRHIRRLREQNAKVDIIAFGPHVDGVAFKRAKTAGATRQVARSKVLDRILSELRERAVRRA